MARRVNRWRCVVLSSGERTVETSIRAGGGKAKSSQIVRLVDVPVARTFGAWDTLHDLPDGAALSNAIEQAAKTHCGPPGRVFLERLTQDNRKEKQDIRDRAGWCRTTKAGREYLFTSGGLREALTGFDFKRALDVLEEAGVLPPAGKDGKRAHLIRTKDRNPARLYPITIREE